DGIKGIVEAAGKDALKGVNEAGGDNENAGKIFATAAGAGANANAAAVAVVAKAVGAVDGKQILKAIVDSADKGGAKANEAKNPIEAAIGGADDDGTAFGEAMKKSDQIAAAIVLRGLAKDGKFAAAGGDKAGDEKIGNVAAVAAHGKKADAANVKEIAGGIKGIVEAAGKDALKDVNRANDNNADAGKIFATTGGGADAEAAAVADVAKAVGAVDGKQILKAIVEAADKGDNGKKADDATNPIEAAIGGANDNAANGFRQGAMKKSDQIAAAIVLRGLAKDGKFAAAANEGALKDVNEAGDDNENAGKIFATGGGGANADAAAVADVAKAVGAVDGKQILKAIVDSADKGDDGAAAANATNPIDAAIGGANDNAANGFGEAAMKKSDQIAAAIVLRGLAKDGKFAAAANEGAGEEKIGNVATGATGATGKQANADNVKEIADGIKGIVEAAGKDALKGVNEAGGDNENAGKIFATAAGAGANAEAVAAVAKAVGAVDGKQILKAIVDSADKGGDGKKANDANNPIDAAIGGADDNGTAFGQGAMQKSDQIAAAIVLRGLAKDGKFAADANEGATAGGKAGSEKIGNVAAGAAGAGKQANADNVKEIAGEIKGIVEAAGEDALKGVNGANDDNADAGKIFATTGVAGANANAAAVAAVAKAVGAVVLV
ncbi:variable large family protein, partial [Borreliella burgdorferi]|uniref:variable large family protein n=1 Tax=Borreliella burgdorferi TaxID=139 RepID=UPI000D02D88D